MAKLKAPLLSLGASGAIGKSIVFFPWKGLDVAREYVIPSNPDTQPQKDQRGYLRDAVGAVHVAMGYVAHPLSEVDKAAYALQGSLEATPRTWFNTIVKTYIWQLCHALAATVFCAFEIVPGTDKLTVKGYCYASSQTPPTKGRLYYGSSKSALVNSVEAYFADMIAGVDIPGLTTDKKYYVQMRLDTAPAYLGCDSGIYHGIPL